MITRVYAHILDEDRKVAASIIMSQHNLRAKEKAPKVLIYGAFGVPGAARTRGLSLRSMAYHVIHGSDVTSNIIPYAE